jgi:hypothetical protein
MRNEFVRSSWAKAVSVLLLATFTPAAMSAAEAPAGEPQKFPATATVRFVGTSTLHDFGGHLPAQPFLLVLSNGTWSAAADVLSGRMATASDKRDRNMHRLLGTNVYPRIHGEVAGAPVPASTTNTITNATLRLKICDRSKDLVARISGWKDSTQDLRFHAEWDLSLKDYGLKPPSVVGVIRVGDKVRLEADVIATKTNLPPRLKSPR